MKARKMKGEIRKAGEGKGERKKWEKEEEEEEEPNERRKERRDLGNDRSYEWTVKGRGNRVKEGRNRETK